MNTKERLLRIFSIGAITATSAACATPIEANKDLLTTSEKPRVYYTLKDGYIEFTNSRMVRLNDGAFMITSFYEDGSAFISAITLLKDRRCQISEAKLHPGQSKIMNVTVQNGEDCLPELE